MSKAYQEFEIRIGPELGEEGYPFIAQGPDQKSGAMGCFAPPYVHDEVDTVLSSRPDVYNHNIETVPRLYREVRPGADYARSLRVLRQAGQGGRQARTKSGLMLGLGETPDEVEGVMRDLASNGVAMLTLGQYLRPSPRHLPVAEFVDPAVFGRLEETARAIGFESVASAPFVRSSYHAGDMASAAAQPDAG